MIINRIYENQNLLSQYLVFFLVGLSTYQHACTDHNDRTLDTSEWINHLNTNLHRLECWEELHPFRSISPYLHRTQGKATSSDESLLAIRMTIKSWSRSLVNIFRSTVLLIYVKRTPTLEVRFLVKIRRVCVYACVGGGGSLSYVIFQYSPLPLLAAVESYYVKSETLHAS